MAEFKLIPLASINVGDRARPVDEDHALAIAANMAERGLINPITVRPTPAAKRGTTPYTLVAGGHRLRAAELNQWTEIDTIVVNADAAEAQLMEISENLFRNELSALDRGLFVMKYREIFEEKNGKVTQGGDRKSKCNDCTLIFAPGRELSERVQDRLGIGRRTYFNVQKIGLNLHPSLREAVRGTAVENDQTRLLKLAKLPPEEQCRIASTLKVERDIDLVLRAAKPTPVKIDPQSEIYSKLIDAWARANSQTKQQFLEHIGMVDPILEAAE
ncbi:ParB N-terminal domain-containing protein [Rhizobium sp. CFBP 8762]|uniref:ParB N-terminal domain-containing protein n=1 Tax=Rhizobium sp. CFBP 8762 TaxID=2775279 RepID=UPI00177EEC29|nr:ParB N-terminal domain-containing protein [Rhizobium sp. CFBP 8762]MBD8554884.1 ParB N-terminal domain-containing protein [Rhizobium sp. CFBP 8762]